MSQGIGRGSAGQIPLPLYGRSEHRLERFVESPDAPVLPRLEQFLDDPSETGFFLCAAEGHGKSHLLVGLAERMGYPAAQYLNLGQLISAPPEPVLEGVERHRLLCLDDVDQVAGNAEWETQLFHVYNRCAQNHSKIIWSASRLPGQAGFRLPDLVSRFAWGMVWVVPELPEERKRDILIARANERGIALSEEVLHYLFSRSQRGMSALMAVLDRLDHESLTAKRGITIPFIKQIMRW